MSRPTIIFHFRDQFTVEEQDSINEELEKRLPDAIAVYGENIDIHIIYDYED